MVRTSAGDGSVKKLPAHGDGSAETRRRDVASRESDRTRRSTWSAGGAVCLASTIGQGTAGAAASHDVLYLKVTF